MSTERVKIINFYSNFHPRSGFKLTVSSCTLSTQLKIHVNARPVRREGLNVRFIVALFNMIYLLKIKCSIREKKKGEYINQRHESDQRLITYVKFGPDPRHAFNCSDGPEFQEATF